MEAGDRRTKGELESDIASVEAQIDELAERHQELSDAQQDLNQEAQNWADNQSIRRSEIQGRLAALEPERQSRFSSLSAQEAKIESGLQRLQREGNRAPEYQTMLPEHRIEKEEELLSQKDELATQRALVEDEFARQTAELQAALADIDVEATKANGKRGERERELQKAIAQVTTQINERKRVLERLRERLNTLLTEEAARSSASDAERVALEQAREMEEQLGAISADRDRLASEVQDLAPLVEAQRDATSAQGAENLGSFYSDSADEHRRA